EALGGDGREFVAGNRQAAERPADQHVDPRQVVRRQPLHARLPSRLAMAEGQRPLPDTSPEELGDERERAAPGTEDVGLRVLRGHATFVLDDVPDAQPTLYGQIARAC